MPASSTVDSSRARFGATGICGTCGGSMICILIFSASVSAAAAMRINSRRLSSSV